MNTPSISTNGLSQIESLSFSSKEDILQLNLTFLITDVKPKEINNKTIYHLSLNDNNKTLSHFLLISQSPRSDIKANNLIHIKTISSSNPSSTRVFLIKSFDIYPTETNDSMIDDINNNNSRDKGIFDSQKCQLIHQLTTFSNHIHLYIKVTHKTQLKPFLNKQNNSNGQLFTFNVIDTEGSEMPITVFNKACDMFYNVIKEGGVYEIKGGNVKLNERKYSNVRSDYKIILDENSHVTEVPDNGLFKDIKLVITNINDIPNKAVGTLVNVLAVVLESNDKMNINTKKGDTLFEKIKSDIVFIEDEELIPTVGNPFITTSPKANPKRNEFLDTLSKRGFSYAKRKYLKIKLSAKLKNGIKAAIRRIHPPQY
jgi:hypothetical protein